MPAFAHSSLWQRLLLLPKAGGLLAGLTLLLLTGLAHPAAAQNGFYKNLITIQTIKGTAKNSQKFYTIRGNDLYSQPFTGVTSLGSFDRNQVLQLAAGEANTVEDPGYTVQSTQLLYRVYPDTTSAVTLTKLPFTPLTLEFQFAGGDNLPNSRNWLDNKTNPNLLAATSGPGTYVLELYFQGEVVNTADPSLNTQITDANGGGNYKTTFTLNPGNTTPSVWLGRSPDWFDATNWSSGVPTPSTDVTIPAPSATIKFYPTINGTADKVAQVRTLRLVGNKRQVGGRLTLSTGELQVYGDFQDANGGFSQLNGSFFTLAGVTQTFDGALFANVRIQGGGTKTLTNAMTVRTSLQFLGLGGVLVTRSDNAVIYNVLLEDNSQLLGETEANYVQGVMRTTKRAVAAGPSPIIQQFSGIGIELKMVDGSPGGVIVTRRTDIVLEGVGTSRGISRSYTFLPDNNVGATYSLLYRYRDAELGNYIKEGNLLLFSSEDGATPFTNLDKTSADGIANTLTRDNIQQLLGGVFTLGDRVNPLPVTLTSFTAVAQGADALLTWTTAQELNSQGFEVQVSTDGKSFGKLGFVASAAANTSAAHTYQYRDATAGKSGIRYYRLRQLDLDGKESFAGPKAVVFGAPTTSLVQAYPNPFRSEITLTLQSPTAGQVAVSVLDGVGRQVRGLQQAVETGTSKLVLPDLQALARGLYIVQVRYSDGQVRRLKLVKE